MNCGKTELLQAMHVVGRRNKAVRWSMDNAAAGCAACHRYFTENPLAFSDFLENLWGEGHLQLLAREGARDPEDYQRAQEGNQRPLPGRGQEERI